MSKKLIHTTLVICLFLGASIFTASSNDLNPQVYYFEDLNEDLQVNNVQYLTFESSKSQHLNFGYSNKPIWIKIKLPAQNAPTFINIKNHYLEEITFYLISDNKVKDSLRTGLKLNRTNEWIIQHTISKNEWLFARIVSKSPLRIPIEIFDQHSYNKNKRSENTILGVFYGIYSIILLFCIFIAIGVRSKLFILYILTFSFVILYSIAYDNLIPDNIGILNKQFWIKGGTTFGALIGLFYIYFSEIFFDLPKRSFGFIRKSFTTFKILLIISIILFIVWYPIGNRSVYYITPIAGLFLSISSAYLLFQRKMTALRFYFIGSTLFIMIAILYAFSNLGIINSQFLSQYGLKLGYLIQIGVFALAIGDKYIIDQKEFKTILEQKVEERTSELENTLNKLRVRQHQLIHSEKMASIGSLTSGIAHELNNPLNFIAGGLTILQNAKEENVKAENFDEVLDLTLPMIQEGLERSSKVVSSLSSFAYGGEPKFEKTDLTELIENTLLVLNSSLPTHITIIRNLTLQENVFVKREGLHQLIFSLLENAIWVIKNENNANGEIRISLSQKKDNPSFYDLSIFNTGAAIEKKIINKIFDPFFSTKANGQGTGLGLSIARSIAKDHKAILGVKNIANGVEFQFSAPFNPQL